MTDVAAVPLADIRPVVRTGAAIAVFGFGGFLAWAALAEVASAVMAPGVVVADTYRKTIQHLEGGIVQDVRVSEGDRVKAGDILVRLDGTADAASLAALTAQLDTALAMRARLVAEQADRKAVTFPDDLMTRAPRPSSAAAMAAQEALFASRLDSFLAERRVLGQRAEQMRRKAEGWRLREKALQDQIGSLEEQKSGWAKLQKSGAISRNELRELERRIAALNGDLGEAIAEGAAAEAAVSEIELQDLTRSKTRREEASAGLADIQAEIARLEEQVRVASDSLDRRAVRAPQDGVVQAIAVKTVGGVISPGQALMELVPPSERIVVEAQIPITEGDRIVGGEEAEIRFPSFDARETPVLFGTVTTVSNDSVVDGEGLRTHYLARVALPPDALPKDLQARVKPGLPVSVFVATEARTVLSYLLRPLADSITTAMRED